MLRGSAVGGVDDVVRGRGVRGATSDEGAVGDGAEDGSVDIVVAVVCVLQGEARTARALRRSTGHEVVVVAPGEEPDRGGHRSAHERGEAACEVVGDDLRRLLVDQNRQTTTRWERALSHGAVACAFLDVLDGGAAEDFPAVRFDLSNPLCDAR